MGYKAFLFPAHAAGSSNQWLCLARSHEGQKQNVHEGSVPQHQFVKALGSWEQVGGVPESEPIAAMSDIQLEMEVKGEGVRVEGTEPSCQVLGNFKSTTLSQGQDTIPKIASPKSLY